MSGSLRTAVATAACLAPMLFASTASAQAGATCNSVTNVCGLGGQIRRQLGFVPIPMSLQPRQGNSGYGSSSYFTTGPFLNATIQTEPPPVVVNLPGISTLPFVGNGLGQIGQIKPTPSATIMQTGPTTVTSGPRQLTMGPGIFQYRDQPIASIPVAKLSVPRLARQTLSSYDFPHPGTTPMGAPAFTKENGTVAIPTPDANILFAGGRVGAATVTFYADASASGSPTNNFGHGVPPTNIQTAMAGEAGSPSINGIARFTATGNQFGGQAVGRTSGTAKVYLNGGSIVLSPDLPCKITATPLEGTMALGVLVPFVTGGPCQFTVSIVDPALSDATVDVGGGAFDTLGGGGGVVQNTAVFTGTIGYNGTIIGQGAPVTMTGAPIPFTRETSQIVGFPMTTGRLSITVTNVDSLATQTHMFVRTGTDARDAQGNGVVALVTGSLTARNISGGNANRTWITLEIPEPNSILAASAGLFALFGCHRLARRRS